MANPPLFGTLQWFVLCTFCHLSLHRFMTSRKWGMQNNTHKSDLKTLKWKPKIKEKHFLLKLLTCHQVHAHATKWNWQDPSVKFFSPLLSWLTRFQTLKANELKNSRSGVQSVKSRESFQGRILLWTDDEGWFETWNRWTPFSANVQNRLHRYNMCAAPKSSH